MSETNPKWRPAFDAYEPTLVQAGNLASAFVESVASKRSPHWLTFGGVPGCGKTLLAQQIFRAAREYNPGLASLWLGGTGVYRDYNRRPRCIWYSASEFADAVRGDFQLPEYLGGDFLVAIDDVGAARDTTLFIADALLRLCNARLNKWTIFTTNYSLAEVAGKIDERIASRLIRDGSVFHRIAAGDYAMRRRA